MEPTTFVLFGATGDLAKRKIYPALYNLYLDGKLPQSFSLIGLGRREWSDAFFQDKVEQSIRQFSRRGANDDERLAEFLLAFRYSVLDIGLKDDYLKLLQLIEQREQALGVQPNRLFYLSVGPEYFTTIADNIQASGLGSANGWKRLVIEKPFGHDLLSARELNEKLSKAFAEEEIFRIDHYLGKPMVQKLGELREAHPELQTLWNDRRINNVQITANETVGVEERAGYYDQVGAVRDMFQNHMLQLLMMAAVHFPHDRSTEHIRHQKKKVMEALEPLQHHEIAANVIRGQYEAGTVQGNPVVGYTSEPGIAPVSMNDTFVAARLQINDPYWQGIPFYIRTGKRTNEKSTRIVVEFEPQPGVNGELQTPELLVVEIGPNEAVKLQVNAEAPVSIHEAQSDVPEAYENLIGDALRGDPAYFAHWDEVELSWQWVQPILDAFAQNLVPLHTYAAGTSGPAASDALLARDGNRWRLDSEPASKSKIIEGAQYAYNANY